MKRHIFGLRCYCCYFTPIFSSPISAKRLSCW